MISIDVSLLLSSVTALFVAVIFATDVVDNLDVGVTSVEECSVVVLMEREKVTMWRKHSCSLA